MAEPLGPGSLACIVCRKAMRQVRGCCRTCYKRNHERVQAGEVTWEELIEQGRALPAKPRRQAPALTYMWNAWARAAAERRQSEGT